MHVLATFLRHGEIRFLLLEDFFLNAHYGTVWLSGGFLRRWDQSWAGAVEVKDTELRVVPIGYPSAAQHRQPAVCCTSQQKPSGFSSGSPRAIK